MGKTELPEAELVQRVFTVREMHSPPSVGLTKRSMLRWFALAVGLISEKESRDTIFQVLDAMFVFQFGKRKQPTTNDLMDHFKGKGKNISEKLLRYHLKRLIDFGLIERKKMKYRFAVDPKSEKDNVRAGFRHSIVRKIDGALEESEAVFGKLAESYRK